MYPFLKKEDIGQILHVVQHCLCKRVDYLDEEEERLANIIVSLLENQNVEQDTQTWIEELTGMVETRLDENVGAIDAYHTKRTVKNFLKSVYIMLNSKEIGVESNKEVFQVLEKWMYLR